MILNRGVMDMNKVKNIAAEGICDFECWDCKLNDDCRTYNHKDSYPILDQKEIRKRFAGEYLMRNESKGKS